MEAPRVTVEGARVRIVFTARSATDVTVAVLDGDGKVVRHLAAGMLGPNAPAPFKRDSLTQVLWWNRRDDTGRAVPWGSYVVRVGLGTHAQFDRLLVWEGAGVRSRGPLGLACGRDGTLYVFGASLWVARGRLPHLKLFDREGNYLRTVLPTPAAVSPDGPYTGVVEGVSHLRRQGIFVDEVHGRAVLVTGDRVPLKGHKPSVRLMSVDPAGGRLPAYGPPLPEGAGPWGSVFLARSPDGDWVYIAGTGRKTLSHCVYRVRWKEKGKDYPEPFAGTPFEKGDDARHLHDPRGLATDGAGRLYVCDNGNNRVQVLSTSGKLLKSLPVQGPDLVAVHPRSGAVYVLSVRDKGASKGFGVKWRDYLDKHLIKYAGLEDSRIVAEIQLPKRKKHMHDAPPLMCLDAEAKEPVLWLANVGRQDPGDYLWKVLDRGDRLERVEHKVRRIERSGISHGTIAVDPARGDVYVCAPGTDGLLRFDARTGRHEAFMGINAPGAKPLNIPASAMVFGPDGLLYVSRGVGKGLGIRRYDHDGNRIPFSKGMPDLLINGSGRGAHIGGFAVAPTRDLYILESVRRGKLQPSRINVYGPDGVRKAEGIIAELTNGSAGVGVDRKGNIYVADGLKPKNLEVPAATAGRGDLARLVPLCGSVFKFGPEGGAIRYRGRAKEGARVAEYLFQKRPIEVEDRLWSYYGISPSPYTAHCVCDVAHFALDRFDRLYVPDALGHAVQVLDRNGNPLFRFGRYGNWDSKGAGSAKPVPEIPLSYPTKVAVAGELAAVYDKHNRRAVLVRLAARVQVDAAVHVGPRPGTTSDPPAAP